MTSITVNVTDERSCVMRRTIQRNGVLLTLDRRDRQEQEQQQQRQRPRSRRSLGLASFDAVRRTHRVYRVHRSVAGRRRYGSSDMTTDVIVAVSAADRNRCTRYYGDVRLGRAGTFGRSCRVVPSHFIENAVPEL